MTVKELIEELQELPQFVPVVVNFKEVTNIEYKDNYYVVDGLNENSYSIGSAVVLE